MRVTLTDGRQICGRFMAYDRHMNLVLGDAEEFRKLPPKKGKSEDELTFIGTPEGSFRCLEQEWLPPGTKPGTWKLGLVLVLEEQQAEDCLLEFQDRHQW
eukprot:gene7803-8000_t